MPKIPSLIVGRARLDLGATGRANGNNDGEPAGVLPPDGVDDGELAGDDNRAEIDEDNAEGKDAVADDGTGETDDSARDGGADIDENNDDNDTAPPVVLERLNNDTDGGDVDGEPEADDAVHNGDDRLERLGTNP